MSKNTTEKVVKNMNNSVVFGIVILIALAAIGFAMYDKPASQDTAVVEGCEPGDLFSRTSGKSCDGKTVESCKEGELYDINTGKPCGQE